MLEQALKSYKYTRQQNESKGVVADSNIVVGENNLTYSSHIWQPTSHHPNTDIREGKQ